MSTNSDGTFRSIYRWGWQPGWEYRSSEHCTRQPENQIFLTNRLFTFNGLNQSWFKTIIVLISQASSVIFEYRWNWNHDCSGTSEVILNNTTGIVQAPVPLSIFRSNSKFDENSKHFSVKYTRPITTIFCTRHDSVTVVTCAKYCCDRSNIFETRAFWIFIKFRIRSKYV